jgi:hypothetical protein
MIKRNMKHELATVVSTNTNGEPVYCISPYISSSGKRWRYDEQTQADKLQIHYAVDGKPGLNEQLSSMGKMTRMMESRALLSSLSQL